MNKFYEDYWSKKEVLEDFHYKWPVLKKFIPNKIGISVLDFGCGKGTILTEMKKLNSGAKFYAIDVSKKALEFIKKKDKKTVFRLIEDGGKLPFKNNFFDFVIASDVLEHVYNTENAFKEISRVLKKNGQILISVPYNGIFKRTIVALFFFDIIYEPSTPHIRSYTKNNLEKYLKKNGIKTQKVGYYGRFFPFSNGIYILGKKN